MKKRRDQKERSGFTLIEVMIAMLLTTLVIIGTWQFFNSSSTTMSMYGSLGIVDERLSLSSDLLMNDARMAGMYSTPNSQADPLVCPRPPLPIRAVEVFDGYGVADDSGNIWDYGNNVNINPDTCLFLIPVTSHLFRPSSMADNTIILEATDLALPATEDEFETMFQGRLLRITGPTGYHQFVRVVSTNFNTRTLALSNLITYVEDNGLCGATRPGGPEHEIAVLTHIRYRILPNPDDPDETLLIREELRPDVTTVVDGTQVVVASNVVDLQCWFDQDSGSQADPNFTSDSDLSDDQGSITTIQAFTNAQRLRVFHYRITGRTDQEFGPVSFQPRQTEGDLIMSFDVDRAAINETAALTLTVGQQVELSNLAVRNLR